MDHPFSRAINLRRIPVEVRCYGCHRWPLGATHRQMGEHIQFDHALWYVRISVCFSNGMLEVYRNTVLVIKVCFRQTYLDAQSLL
jgi:hypothetical protein